MIGFCSMPQKYKNCDEKQMTIIGVRENGYVIL